MNATQAGAVQQGEACESLVARSSRAVWLVWSLFALVAAPSVLQLVLPHLVTPPVQLNESDHELAGEVLFLVLPTALAVIGGLIVSRRSNHPVGWVFFGMGADLALTNAAGGYASYGLPGSRVVALLGSILGGPLILGFFPFLFLLFPTGRLPSPRWRPIVWLVATLVVVQTAFAAVTPGPIRFYPNIDNPFGIQAVGRDNPVFNASFLLLVALIPVSAASLVVRFRRARGDERQQLKWFAYAAPLAALIIGSGPILWSIPEMKGSVWTVLFMVALLLPPTAAAIAILKYRLYDIDLLINRTLVYLALTACVVSIYTLVVGYFGTIVQARGDAISLLAAGLVAVLFQPLRDRLQRGVNRLLYGQREEPYTALAQLGHRLEATLAPGAVLPTIVETIRETLKLSYVAIALPGLDGAAFAASAGAPVEPTLDLTLVYQHEEVGQLRLGPRAPGEPLNPADRHLLQDLARQAGIAVHAERLTSDLQRARERLVAAREEERRRLRRDLHDGLGPQLASQALTIDAARKLLRSDPGRADALLTHLREHTQAAVADVRRLVYELRPPALDDLGLVLALRQQASQYEQGGLRVRIDAPDSPLLLPAAVEVAAYRIAQEALTNIVRHAQASSCVVRLSAERKNGRLCLEVSDDGCGLPADIRSGVGLVSMRERATELGGRCAIESSPDGGTRVSVQLPMPEETTWTRSES